MKKGVLRNLAEFTNATEFNSSQSCNFIKKETFAQVFSCEFRKIFSNNYFEVHPQTAASRLFGNFLVKHTRRGPFKVHL